MRPSPRPAFAACAARPALRDLVAENRLSVKDLIWPLFVTDVPGADAAVPSMPGVSRLTVEGTVRAAEEAAKLGIRRSACSPIPIPA